MTRVLLIHGAATTGSVWQPVLAALARRTAGGQGPSLRVRAPDRASSGDLESELAAVADEARGAVVVGVGGGATLGLAMLCRGVCPAAVVLHEPAVGSWVPDLLTHVVEGFRSEGVAGFGAALYGSRWSPDMAGPDPQAVANDLAMFRAFEPGPVTVVPAGPMVTTVGAASPRPRHLAARALVQRLGFEAHALPGTGHFVQAENPEALADVVVGVIGRLPTASNDHDRQP